MNEGTLNDKLATPVDGVFTPDIAQLSEDVRINQKTGGKLPETDLMGEVEEHSLDSGGMISRAKPGEKEVEGLSSALSGLSCSYVLEQTREEDETALCTERMDGPPIGFTLIFPYVDLKSLLTLERVSKPMRMGVSDVLAWTKLHVEPPLSTKLTNYDLLSFVKRAKGILKCLSLVGCSRIADETLEQVLSISPQLEKLFIPGCTALSADGVLSMLQQHTKEARAKGMSGIKQLRLRGIYNITQQHLDAFRAVILPGRENKGVHPKPVYWNKDPMSLLQDDRAIDIEICPRCRSESPTVVYDCTQESCQKVGGLNPSKACRGCIICIPRCVGCGTCFLKDEVWEKTCCADLLCLTCWLKFPKCAECNDAFCRRHKFKSYSRYPEGARLCQICLTRVEYCEDQSSSSCYED